LSLVRVGFQLEGATPQIDPIAPQLKKRLSELLTIDSTDIGITATTGEDLTAFGRGEGLQCFATVTLV
jgi:2-C-methyl-D-erythritol 2,4-cyclodiphosphate synthase